MKSFLTILAVVFFAVAANGQPFAITNFTGTATYGSENVTVTSVGGVTTWSGCLGPPTEYWIGSGTSGGDIYTLSRPVYSIYIQTYALNGGEYIETYLNGSYYAVTAADMLSYTGCGSSGTGPCYLSGGNVWGPTGGSSNYNGYSLAIHTCTPITSFEFYCVTNSGMTYHLQVDTTAPTCFSATCNTPCLNDTLLLKVIGDTTGATFLWSGPGSFTSTLIDPFRYPMTYADTGIYRVIKTALAVPDTAYTHVVLRARPPVFVTNDGPLCAGVTDTLHLGVTPDSVGETFYWVGPNSFTSTSEFPVIGSFLTADTGTYMVIGNLSGCRDTGYTFVSLLPPPLPPIITGITSYCQGDIFIPFTLSGVTAGVLWYTSATGGTGTSTASVNTAVPGVYTFWADQGNAGCPRSARASITVVVNPTPLPPVITGTLQYCQFVPYNLLFASGTDIKWYTTPTEGTGSTTQPTINTSLAGVTTLYASQTNDTSGCESPRTAVTVVVNAKPEPPGVTPLTLCQMDTVGPLTALGASLTWYIPGDTTGFTNAPVPNTQNGGVFDYFVTQTVLGCVSDKAELPVTVIDMPYATYYIKKDICQGDTTFVSLVNRSGNAATFAWLFDGYTSITSDGGEYVTSSSVSGGPFSVFWSSVGVHVIQMNISSIEGCRGLSTLDTVNIHPKPDASFAPVKGDATCILDSIMLRANIQSSAYLYVWQPAHFFDNSNNFEVWGQIEFPGYVTLTVTDPYGCYNSDSVEFNPGECCIVSFPSAFTPNGDGKNDYFRPLYKGFHRFHEFRVENRWGETVFQTNSSTVEWDGTHNGVPQDLGVYFYYLKFDCGGGAREVRGDVTLIR